ncbi:protein NYNRIN-like [Telopea speciosissima]|uniref:protein NYNRIN-like n=1 Tax=Telopea speciosissima TaxID=54955 RepID=UPI001CC6E0FA|nr:protein NYNRIN-like [Telopea speciosissima]
MEVDCVSFMRRCHKCQIFANIIHIPSKELHSLNAPWPFSTWGIDIIGKVMPKASNGHEFILLAIDYFTQWLETQSYAVLTAVKVAKFIKEIIICKYGVPHALISDQRAHFWGKADKFYTKFGIQRYWSTTYRPQTNGAVEATNTNVKVILHKMADTHTDWAEKLLYALWAY